MYSQFYAKFFNLTHCITTSSITFFPYRLFYAMSFRLKTILGIALIEAILLVILVWNSLSFLQTSNEEELYKRASTTATLFATAVKDAVLSSDLASLDTFVFEMLKNPGVVYARIVDDQGILAQDGNIELLKSPFIADNSISSVQDGVFDTFAEVIEGGFVFGKVEIGLSIKPMLQVMQKAQSQIISIALLEILLVALFSWGLGMYLTHQLVELEHASHTLAAGNLGFQIPVRGKDELAQTALAFNTMSMHLQDTYKALETSAEESRRITACLTKSEQQLRAIMDGMLDGMITINQLGIIQSFNLSAERIFGYSSQDILGQSLSILMPEPHRSQHNNYIKRYLKTREPHAIGFKNELTGIRADGSAFPVELSITELETGEEHLFIGIVRDITKTKLAEQELRKLSRAVAQSPMTVVITDPQGNIEYVNAAFTKSTGFDYEEVLGKNPRIVKSGQVDEQVYQELWQTISMGKVWEGELLNKRKNGEVYWEYTVVSPLRNKENKITHYLAVKEDVTRRKQAESQLKTQNEALIRLNQEKNEFLGIAAHDLKNPLSAIQGMAEYIQEEIEELPRDEIVDSAHMIEESAKKMFQLVTNLLDVNAIESGKVNISPEIVDIFPIMQTLVKEYTERAKNKNIRIHFEFSESHYPAFVDKHTTQQVLDNLISNAVKYSPTEKSIYTRIVAGQKAVRCEIKDEGQGLSIEDQQKLFGKFTRLTAKPTGGEHSTGLGLFIVKKLVDAMHGKVWCESELGKGALFIVEFPKQRNDGMI